MFVVWVGLCISGNLADYFGGGETLVCRFCGFVLFLSRVPHGMYKKKFGVEIWSQVLDKR
jgi:hypothetical protein